MMYSVYYHPESDDIFTGEDGKYDDPYVDTVASGLKFEEACVRAHKERIKLSQRTFVEEIIKVCDRCHTHMKINGSVEIVHNDIVGLEEMSKNLRGVVKNEQKSE